ncbi:MAG: DNA mismatch repair endonuclease MutL [Kiritimatiellia bacterium]
MSEPQSIIRELPEQVANQIAAGEVVERPASVLKELLENAIDAGARRIEVEISEAGRKLVAVHDDGKGMTPEDARLCLKRQATSKITCAEDIDRVTTLGFRGEAIPSIASVSRFLIRTRPAASDIGTEVAVTGGRLLDIRETGCPAGTSVEVRDLFFNLPARRKFLRAYATEQARLRAVFIDQALAHPDLGFSLKADGRELHRLPPDGTLEERIATLLGIETRTAMRPVDYRQGDIHIGGWVGLPTFTRPDRAEQYIFVNRRPATAPAIGYAISSAYPRQPDGGKPVLILFIDLPPQQVDVNVHPAKREVRFRRPDEVKQALRAAIEYALGLRPQPPENNPSSDTQPRPPDPPTTPLESPPSTPAPAPLRHDDLELMARLGITPQQTLDIPPGQTETPPHPWKWTDAKIAACPAGRYIILETPEGLVLVEPKAAYERILYERLRDGEILSQRLLLPQSVKLPPLAAERLRAFLPDAEQMGFGLADMGSDTFLLDALPAPLIDTDPRVLLPCLAEDLATLTGAKRTDRWRELLLSSAAAQAAKGFTRNLDLPRAEALIRLLSETRMPYIDPRGRPVMILKSWRELARIFQRNS